MRIKVTGYYTPDPEEIDPADNQSGLTEEAWEKLQYQLTDDVGLEDVKLKRTWE